MIQLIIFNQRTCMGQVGMIQLRTFNQRTGMGQGGSDTAEDIQPEDRYDPGRE